jgi:alpha-tubulin suppressor-like RCC1 family protein
VKEISVGLYHVVVSTTSDKVYAWGDGRFGRVGRVGNESEELLPYELDQLRMKKIFSLGCGSAFSVALVDMAAKVSFLSLMRDC